MNIHITRRKTRTGDVVHYKLFFAYLCLMVTIIVLLLMKEFGWLQWIDSDWKGL